MFCRKTNTITLIDYGEPLQERRTQHAQSAWLDCDPGKKEHAQAQVG